MVGQWTVTKPGRSDEVLEADQQQRITAQIRAHFDSITPKRPAKPSRSESDSPLSSPSHAANGTIPELHKFRTLQSQSQSESHVRKLLSLTYYSIVNPALFRWFLVLTFVKLSGHDINRWEWYVARGICGDALLQGVGFYWQTASHGSTPFFSVPLSSFSLAIFSWNDLIFICND